MPGALRNREILLGVSGSIAAYKAPELVRRFKDQGARVTCVMTPSAARFVTPLTLSALSGRPVAQDIFEESQWEMAHLSLAKKSDAVVVAPCTADLIASLAGGRSNTLLSAIVLTTRKPVFLVPALHEPMWTHPSTQKNAAACKSYGYSFIGPVRGALASNEVGWGRMEEPGRVVSEVAKRLAKPQK